jgi:hypothetical protein
MPVTKNFSTARRPSAKHPALLLLDADQPQASNGVDVVQSEANTRPPIAVQFPMTTREIFRNATSKGACVDLDSTTSPISTTDERLTRVPPTKAFDGCKENAAPRPFQPAEAMGNCTIDIRTGMGNCTIAYGCGAVAAGNTRKRRRAADNHSLELGGLR